MEMGKSSQKTATNTQYGAISGTTSSTSTGSDNLLGSGNYSPLGPTACKYKTRLNRFISDLGKSY